MHTVADCTLDEKPIPLHAWVRLSPDELASVVGVQGPGGVTEYAEDYTWRFAVLPTEDLRSATEDGEEPEDGWEAAYLEQAKSDAEAVASGSPQYAGRQEWLRNHWCRNTAIYPLFVVEEEDGYRLWDGYRRLAGAFRHGLAEVAVLIGRPRP